MLAIDPGKSGGIVIGLPGQAVTGFHMPETCGELLRKLELAIASGANTAYMEDIIFYNGIDRPGSSMVKYGMMWGRVEGMLHALKTIRIVLVHPKKWQGALGIVKKKGTPQPEWKNQLKAEAEKLFPDIKVTLAIADALLILEAARRGALG